MTRALELARGAVERLGPAALVASDAPQRLRTSFGVTLGEATALINAERRRRER